MKYYLIYVIGQLCSYVYVKLFYMSNSGISSSNIVSFADDTRLYHGISNIDNYSFLQHDLNCVYDWASCNNMPFNTKKNPIYMF